MQKCHSILLDNSCSDPNRICINFINIDPINALVYAAVINGVVAVPILIAIMKIADDKNNAK
jgi:hypothetical protein